MDKFRLIILKKELDDTNSIDLSQYNIDTILSVYIIRDYFKDRQELKFEYNSKSRFLKILNTTQIDTNDKIFIELYSLSLYRNKLINEILDEK
jgi:hypothetical protein